MKDEQAATVIDRILALACALRDDLADAPQQAAAALTAAGGDPIAVLSVAAALIDVDQPVQTWWQDGLAGLRVNDRDTLAPDAPRRVLRPCGTHAAFNRHVDRGEPIDEACEEAERIYRAQRSRVRRARQASAA